MNRHSAIRAAILAKLKAEITDTVTWFDGRPVFLEEQDLPAVAVYLSDAEYTGDSLDEDSWQAVVHIEVFLKASSPDSALDSSDGRESVSGNGLHTGSDRTGRDVHPAGL